MKKLFSIILIYTFLFPTHIFAANPAEQVKKITKELKKANESLAQSLVFLTFSKLINQNSKAAEFSQFNPEETFRIIEGDQIKTFNEVLFNLIYSETPSKMDIEKLKDLFVKFEEKTLIASRRQIIASDLLQSALLQMKLIADKSICTEENFLDAISYIDLNNVPNTNLERVYNNWQVSFQINMDNDGELKSLEGSNISADTDNPQFTQAGVVSTVGGSVISALFYKSSALAASGWGLVIMAVVTVLIMLEQQSKMRELYKANEKLMKEKRLELNLRKRYLGLCNSLIGTLDSILPKIKSLINKALSHEYDATLVSNIQAELKEKSKVLQQSKIENSSDIITDEKLFNDFFHFQILKKYMDIYIGHLKNKNYKAQFVDEYLSLRANLSSSLEALIKKKQGHIDLNRDGFLNFLNDNINFQSFKSSFNLNVVKFIESNSFSEKMDIFLGLQNELKFIKGSGRKFSYEETRIIDSYQDIVKELKEEIM